MKTKPTCFYFIIEAKNFPISVKIARLYSFNVKQITMSKSFPPDPNCKFDSRYCMAHSISSVVFPNLWFTHKLWLLMMPLKAISLDATNMLPIFSYWVTKIRCLFANLWHTKSVWMELMVHAVILLNALCELCVEAMTMDFVNDGYLCCGSNITLIPFWQVCVCVLVYIYVNFKYDR